MNKLIETLAIILVTGTVTIAAATIPAQIEKKTSEKLLLIEKAEEIAITLSKASSIVDSFQTMLGSFDCKKDTDVDIVKKNIVIIQDNVKRVDEDVVVRSDPAQVKQLLDYSMKLSELNEELANSASEETQETFKEYWSVGYEIHHGNTYKVILFFDDYFSLYKNIARDYGRIGQLFVKTIYDREMLCENPGEFAELEKLLGEFEYDTLIFHSLISQEINK